MLQSSKIFWYKLKEGFAFSFLDLSLSLSLSLSLNDNQIPCRFNTGYALDLVDQFFTCGSSSLFPHYGFSSLCENRLSRVFSTFGNECRIFIIGPRIANFNSDKSLILFKQNESRISLFVRFPQGKTVFEAIEGFANKRWSVPYKILCVPINLSGHLILLRGYIDIINRYTLINHVTNT